jgi:hypothetical protein
MESADFVRQLSDNPCLFSVIKTVYLYPMGLIRVAFWVALFVAFTFAWVVVFQHGFSNFSENAQVEFTALKKFLKIEESATPAKKVGTPL